MKMLIASLLFLVAAAAQAPPAATQPPDETVKPEDRCSVEGTVLNLQTAEPLKKAHVTLQSMESQKFSAPLGAMTDAAGHFLIDEVAPGKYKIAAERNGFVRTEYGSKGPDKPGTQITLSKGQKLKDIDFRMTLNGVISGKVVDEDGEPLARVQIMLMRPTYSHGRKTLGNGVNASSDDRGEYRAWGLAPGRYYVCAVRAGNPMQDMEVIKDNPQEGYAPVFFPNSLTSAQSSPVEVTAGGEVSGIDFRLSPTHTARVSGKIVNPPGGNSFVVAFVSLVSREDGIGWNAGKHSVADEKGVFVFRNVTPGSYTLMAQSVAPAKPDAEPQVAQAAIEVGDSNVEGVQLTLGAAPEISGVVTAGKGADLKNRTLILVLSPEDTSPMMRHPYGQVQDDGTFKLKLEAPGRYHLEIASLPEDYYVKSIRYGDSDFPSNDLDLTRGATGGQLAIAIAANAPRVDGDVKDPKDQPATSATVVLIPDQRDLHGLYHVANTDQNGHFNIKGIKPGKYKLFAWDDVQGDQYEDPDFLKPFEDKGEAIEFSEGDKFSKDLTLIVSGNQ
jgi:protocatechuate 3,4-dioxygenase beta subunit